MNTNCFHKACPAKHTNTLQTLILKLFENTLIQTKITDKIYITKNLANKKRVL